MNHVILVSFLLLLACLLFVRPLFTAVADTEDMVFENELSGETPATEVFVEETSEISNVTEVASTTPSSTSSSPILESSSTTVDESQENAVLEWADSVVDDIVEFLTPEPNLPPLPDFERLESLELQEFRGQRNFELIGTVQSVDSDSLSVAVENSLKNQQVIQDESFFQPDKYVIFKVSLSEETVFRLGNKTLLDEGESVVVHAIKNDFDVLEAISIEVLTVLEETQRKQK